ncbi:MAG TPA: Tol-Pal system protein TolB [Alphaproteobacteria bacterium]|nr:Tol-Pal system protein TolB [Alphaproteobacteria bacterium]
MAIYKNFFVLLLILILTLPNSSYAVLKIDITQGKSEPIRIATPAFVGPDSFNSSLGARITSVIDNNLNRSGLFNIVNKGSYIQNITGINTIPEFSGWKNIRSQALLIGYVESEGDGRIKVQFRLWDVLTGKQTLAKSFRATAQGWRRVGHLISDAIYEYLTGEKGYFDTRIVYVSETGDPRRKIKRLAIMDQDGANNIFLTSGRALVLTPRFDPTMQRLIYLSYRTRLPSVNIYNLSTGREEILGQLPGMSFAPRFSNDGTKAIFSISINGNSDIYSMDLATRRVKKLTSHPGIDTSPSYSPDDSQITFNSDREGTQQLYVMNADGSNVKRISYGNGRYATPVWSPRGDLIAFTKMAGGKFYIGVMKPDGSGERMLTSSYLDEGPTWSPNGRVIIFSRKTPGYGGMAGKTFLYSVDITGYNLRKIGTATEASDPAWSPLLSK